MKCSFSLYTRNKKKVFIKTGTYNEPNESCIKSCVILILFTKDKFLGFDVIYQTPSPKINKGNNVKGIWCKSMTIDSILKFKTQTRYTVGTRNARLVCECECVCVGMTIVYIKLRNIHIKCLQIVLNMK